MQLSRDREIGSESFRCIGSPYAGVLGIAIVDPRAIGAVPTVVELVP